MLPNALKVAASAKRKEREGSASSTRSSSRGSESESRKRKRSALEEIRMVHLNYHACRCTYDWMLVVLMQQYYNSQLGERKGKRKEI